MKLYSPGSGALVHWLSWWVDNSNVTMVFGGDISLGHGVYKLKTGGVPAYIDLLLRHSPYIQVEQPLKFDESKSGHTGRNSGLFLVFGSGVELQNLRLLHI